MGALLVSVGIEGDEVVEAALLGVVVEAVPVAVAKNIAKVVARRMRFANMGRL
jgi:hypothetical protein